MCNLSTLTVVFPLPLCLTAKTCELMRDCAKCVIPITAGPAALTWARRDRQQVAVWDSEALCECQTFAR
jgi:hypothetical protein